MMAGTYERRSQDARKSRLLATYELSQEYSRVSISGPPPFNILLLLYACFGFLFNYCAIQAKFPECTLGQRLELYLSGAFSSLDVAGQHEHSTDEEYSCLWDGLPLLKVSICIPPLSTLKHWIPAATSWKNDNHMSPRNDMIDFKCQTQLSMFMEHARSKVINKVHPKETLEGKVEHIQEAVQHVQTMQEAIQWKVASNGGPGGGAGGGGSKVEAFRILRQTRQKAAISETKEKIVKVAQKVGRTALLLKKGWSDDLLPYRFANQHGGVPDDQEQEYIKQHTEGGQEQGCESREGDKYSDVEDLTGQIAETLRRACVSAEISNMWKAKAEASIAKTTVLEAKIEVYEKLSRLLSIVGKYDWTVATNMPTSTHSTALSIIAKSEPACSALDAVVSYRLCTDLISYHHSLRHLST